MRLLSQDSVPTWDVWQEAAAALDGASPADEARIAQDSVTRFTRITVDHVQVDYQSDAERKEELQLRGARVGQGEVWALNTCLAVSLLQV